MDGAKNISFFIVCRVMKPQGIWFLSNFLLSRKDIGTCSTAAASLRRKAVRASGPEPNGVVYSCYMPRKPLVAIQPSQSLRACTNSCWVMLTINSFSAKTSILRMAISRTAGQVQRSKMTSKHQGFKEHRPNIAKRFSTTHFDVCFFKSSAKRAVNH